MKKILYLTHRIPYPPNKGDKIRSYHILRFLNQHYDVYLGSFIDDEEDLQYISKVEQYCKECCIINITQIKKIKSALKSYISGRSMSEEIYFNKALENWVIETIEKEKISYVFSFSSVMGQYAFKFKDKILTSIVDYVDVDSEKWRAYSGRRTFPLNLIYKREAKLLLAFEKKISNVSKASLFVTPDEASLFKKVSHIQKDIFSILNGVDTEYFNANLHFDCPYLPSEKKIVFTGRMDYWPNIEGVVWFVEHVFKRVLDRFPDAKFYIVGAKPTAQVLNLRKISGVQVTGQVPDVRPFLKYADCAVAPLFIGRGIQNKVLEAMAMSIPLVVSEAALTGIDVLANCPVSIANEPTEWVEYISLYIKNTTPLSSLDLLRKNVINQYSWHKTLEPIKLLLS